PFNVPSIFSSMKVPPSSDRIVDVALVGTPGPLGLNQKVISTSQVPAIAVRRACSGPAGGSSLTVVTAAIALTTTTAAIKQIRGLIIDSISSMSATRTVSR